MCTSRQSIDTEKSREIVVREKGGQGRVGQENVKRWSANRIKVNGKGGQGNFKGRGGDGEISGEL